MAEITEAPDAAEPPEMTEVPEVTETPAVADEVLQLGIRIRARRQELGMSLRDLARVTGLSATFLSSLERGMANPTLESLRRVSNALNTPILRLAENGRSSSPVVRHDQRKAITLPLTHVRYEIMTPTLTKKMVLFQVEASVEQGNLVIERLPDTEECLVVVSGNLSVCVAGQSYELEPQDSIYFEGRYLESIRVTSPGGATFISAMTPPAF
jgi:transcriptional regulator with XRE-family HTH domain